MRVLLKRIAVNKLPTTLWLGHTTDNTNSPNSKTESSVLGNGHRDRRDELVTVYRFLARTSTRGAELTWHK